MKEYHKIQTVYKRDPNAQFKTLLEGEYSLPVFEYLQFNPWVFTEKVDGTNIRVTWNGESLAFHGKTDNGQMPPFLLARLKSIFEPQQKRIAERFPDGVCLYGEGFGARIQKGGDNYGATQYFALFDVKIGTFWLERHNVEEIARHLGLQITPVIGEGTLPEMVEVARAGIQSCWGDFQAEGIVARPKVELASRDGSRIITKIKTRDFPQVAKRTDPQKIP